MNRNVGRSILGLLAVKAGVLAGWLIYEKYGKDSDLKSDFTKAKNIAVKKADEVFNSLKGKVNSAVEQGEKEEKAVIAEVASKVAKRARKVADAAEVVAEEVKPARKRAKTKAAAKTPVRRRATKDNSSTK